eukprot:symbB.v1.2.001527.t1/scaffold83.1/size345278/11
MCNILCKPRNGWTIESFCNANYSAICTQNWRLGYKQTKCVSPYVDFKEKVLMETATVIDSTVCSRGKEAKPELDSTTRSFCFKQCQSALEKEREWSFEDVWQLCRNPLTTFLGSVAQIAKYSGRVFVWVFAMGKKRIQTTASAEATRLAEDKDLGVSYGPGPDGNKFDILMQEETDGVVAAERISRILKKRGVCLCEANAPPELLSQAFDEAEVLWKAGEFGPPMQVFDSDSQFEAQLWQQVLYQDEQKVLWMSDEASSSKRRMEALKLLSQNMLEFSRGLGDILAQETGINFSHSWNAMLCLPWPCAMLMPYTGATEAEPPEADPPEQPAKRRRSAKAKAKAKGKVDDRAAYQRVQLLCWLGRLRYLHEACCNEFLQSVCLSTWGSGDPLSTDELLRSFHDNLDHEAALEDEYQKLPMLLRAPLELAVCFVALCRALAWPSRLVLAFDLKEPQKPLRKFFPPKGTSPQKFRQPPAPVATVQDDPIEVDDDEDLRVMIEGPAMENAKQLIELGFGRQQVIQAVLEAQDDPDPFGKALDLLSELAPETSSPNAMDLDVIVEVEGAKVPAVKTAGTVTCDHCQEIFQKGAFCGNCGQRMRDGGAVGASDAKEPDDDDFLVTAWAEIFDSERGRWVAVDVAFGDIISDPVVEWLHRGTPMVWICAASQQGYSDVTPRYSSRWWEVEQAREPSGNRPLQTWWKEFLESQDTSVHGSTEWSPSREAEAQDKAFLSERRKNDGVPRNKQALKHHEVYCLGPKKFCEYLRPGAKSVACVEGAYVYRREDVTVLRTPRGWMQKGRRVMDKEKPIKAVGEKSSLRNNGNATMALAIPEEEKAGSKDSKDLFGEWQTQPHEPTKGSRKSIAPTGLPALPAPAKKRKVSVTPLKGFEEKIEKLKEWMKIAGRSPWEKANDDEERTLGLWVLSAKKRILKGGVPQEQRRALQMLELIEEDEEMEESEPPEAPAAEPEAPEAAPEHGVLKISGELERLSGDMRWKMLQQWRRSYHPDKNFGREEEVKPIFHFVQDTVLPGRKKWPSSVASREATEAPPPQRRSHRETTTRRRFHRRCDGSCYTGNRSYALHIDNPHKSGGPMELPDNGLRVTLVYYINPHWDPDSGDNGGGLDVFLTDPNSAPPSASTARKAPKLRIAPHADTLAIFLAERMAHQVVETMGKERMYCLTMWCFDQFALSNFVPQVSQKQRDMQAGSDDDI